MASGISEPDPIFRCPPLRFPPLVTLPALQKHFANIFFRVFAREFCIEKRRGFLVNFFLVSVSHETKHENSSKDSGKIRSRINEFGAKFNFEPSRNSGHFRSATFLTSPLGPPEPTGTGRGEARLYANCLWSVTEGIDTAITWASVRKKAPILVKAARLRNETDPPKKF